MVDEVYPAIMEWQVMNYIPTASEKTGQNMWNEGFANDQSAYAVGETPQSQKKTTFE